MGDRLDSGGLLSCNIIVADLIFQEIIVRTVLIRNMGGTAFNGCQFCHRTGHGRKH